MSRQIWLDRTIDAARDAIVRLPWDRRPASEPEREERPAPLPARAAG